MVFLSDATAALATTKATVALSVSFLAWVRLTTNEPGIFSLLVETKTCRKTRRSPLQARANPEAVRRGIVREQLVVREPAPRRNVVRGGYVERDDAQHAAGH